MHKDFKNLDLEKKGIFVLKKFLEWKLERIAEFIQKEVTEVSYTLSQIPLDLRNVNLDTLIQNLPTREKVIVSVFIEYKNNSKASDQLGIYVLHVLLGWNENEISEFRGKIVGTISKDVDRVKRSEVDGVKCSLDELIRRKMIKEILNVMQTKLYSTTINGNSSLIDKLNEIKNWKDLIGLLELELCTIAFKPEYLDSLNNRTLPAIEDNNEKKRLPDGYKENHLVVPVLKGVWTFNINNNKYRIEKKKMRLAFYWEREYSNVQEFMKELENQLLKQKK